MDGAADQLRTAAADLEDAALRTWVETAAADRRFLDFVGFVFRHSPFLSHCALRDLAGLRNVLEQGPDTCLTHLVAHMKDELALLRDRDALMRELRVTRRRVALLTGLADIAGHWPLDRITQALSDFADGALSATISHLLRQAADANEIVLADPYFPEDQCGYVALAMGKHGGRELNYSSDIDLIVIYEPTLIDYRGTRSHQQFVERMTRNLIAIMQEATVDGYVCRVDLNLRPDPGATPLAVSMAAAQKYYRHRGENWERAAMIKARPAAGDLNLGRQFLDDLTPFVWREAMDFWLLQDMRAMKQRINAHKGGGEIAVAGHNVKLGRGGIREIEFYAQTQQLIYGGLDPYLRCARTVEALTTLAEAGHVSESVADELTECYEFLRRLEHRLQMTDDRQTQTMPADDDGVARVASFMAFETVGDFKAALLERLGRVQSHYNRLFETAPDAHVADWTFALEMPDERMAAAIAALGFADVAGTYRRLSQWHRLGFRPGQDNRTLETLRPLIPGLARAAARMPNPDVALAALESHLSHLRGGLRFFSILSAHPSLLELVLEIVTLAPALADDLARRSERLQMAVAPTFFGLLPDGRMMRAECTDIVHGAYDLQDAIAHIDSWANDYRFQVAANLLQHRIDAHDAGLVLSDLADAVVEQASILIAGVQNDQAKPLERMAAVAIGAWGSRDLAPAAPIELLFISEDGHAGQSAGPLARRIIALCAARSANGHLCDVELARELWGAAGPLVTPLDALVGHVRVNASAEQLMAMMELRVIAGPLKLRSEIESAARDLLSSPVAAQALLAHARALVGELESAGEAADHDVSLCARIRAALDATVRALQARHAGADSEVLTPPIAKALGVLARRQLLAPEMARSALDVRHRLRQIEAMWSARFGPDVPGDRKRMQVDAELLLAAGIVDGAEWRAFLTEGVMLLRAMRDAHLQPERRH
jgi:[glutamine synthetase] adenylyltransferase / [glutamine synthetase]-adenylyl-L-tyrosine phosphorylase